MPQNEAGRPHRNAGPAHESHHRKSTARRRVSVGFFAEGMQRLRRGCFACSLATRARLLGAWFPPSGKLEAELLRRSMGNRSHTCGAA